MPSPVLIWNAGPEAAWNAGREAGDKKKRGASRRVGGRPSQAPLQKKEAPVDGGGGNPSQALLQNNEAPDDGGGGTVRRRFGDLLMQPLGQPHALQVPGFARVWTGLDRKNETRRFLHKDFPIF